MRFEFGRATFFAIQAMFEPWREGVNDEGFDGELARACVRFLDAMRLPGKWRGRAAVDLTDRERELLAEEFEHLGSTPALLPEFEDERRNEMVRLAFSNIARAMQAKPVGE